MWDDPMNRDLSALDPPGSASSPVALIRQLRAHAAAQGLAERATESRPSSSSKERSSSRARSKSPNSPKSPWQTYWNPKEESKKRFLRSTRSAKLDRRFPEQRVIPQDLPSFTSSHIPQLRHQDRSPQMRDWEMSPDTFQVSWDSSTGRRYASSDELINTPLLGQMLLDASSKGDLVQVQGILDQAELDQQNLPSVLASRDLDDRTPLHCAARQGHVEVCDLLLKRNADALSTSGPPAATALMLASLHGHEDVVRRLLWTQADAQLAKSDTKGRNALHLACCSNWRILRHLLQRRPELVNAQDQMGRNLLYYALGNPNGEEQWEILHTLLQRKCDAHQVDYLGRSPLWYAVNAGAVNATALILRLSTDRTSEHHDPGVPKKEVGEDPKPDAKPAEKPKEEAKEDPKPDAKPAEKPKEEAGEDPKPDAKPAEKPKEEAKEDPKPDAKGVQETNSVPEIVGMPFNVSLETPRNYGDPLPILKSVVAESKDDNFTTLATELKDLLEKHTYLNPQTANHRHPLHCWVSRCSQQLGDGKLEEAKACLARVVAGLDIDMTRISTAFRRFDMDESNHLDETEIMRLAAYLGFDVDPADLDHNTDGEISLAEFQDFVGRMGGVQQLFEQRRRRVAETRRDTLSIAGVAIGARVRAHFYAGKKPNRCKSLEPAEAVVLGVHVKDDEMVGCSLMEVELEFLGDPKDLDRTKKTTCVPSHWVVFSLEDAEVAAALREVGIHNEDQPFWEAVYPPSEMREVFRLTWCQRRALAQVRAQATSLHKAAYPRVLKRFDQLGYKDMELQAVLNWVQDLAPVIIHVQIDTVGRFLESDEYYRNQFETKTSNGALDDGNHIRIGWEEALFGDAYDAATPFERCKYGALNVTNDFEGVKSAIQYGDSYLVLKDVRLRCSFAATDSGGIEGSRLAVLDKYAHVLEEYEDHEIRSLVEVATAPAPRPSEELPKLMRGSTEDCKKEWVTFGFPQLKRKEGCFFFEVELREGCILPQLGLAGDQFVPKVGVKSVTGIGGIGDDEYSCGVDGLHRACLKNGPISSWNVNWPSGDSADFVQIDFDCQNREREEKEILGKTVVVGVLVDFDRGAVMFTSDGEWGSAWKPQIVEEDLPCSHEGLFPAISVKGSAVFRFGPEKDFHFPPPKSFCNYALWPRAGQGEIRLDNPAVGCSNVLNIYKEAQIHGSVSLKDHVLRLVANERYRHHTRSWNIQVTGAGRCNGTYKWSDRVNRRSCYKSPSGCIIYYNEQDSSWRMHFKEDLTGFVFQAPMKKVATRYVGNMVGNSEPPRTGWKPANGLRGCVPMEIFQRALMERGVEEEDLEKMTQALRGTEEEKDLIFRKSGETTFKAEWHRLKWPFAARPPSATFVWAEVVRMAQAEILKTMGFSMASAVVVSPQGTPDHGTWECLVSLGPKGNEEPDSTGVAVHVINLQGAEELEVFSPMTWYDVGAGGLCTARIHDIYSWVGHCEDPVPGMVIERGFGTLRRVQLDLDALTRSDLFWELQEQPEGAEMEKSISGRWCSRGARCAFRLGPSKGGNLWLLRNQTGPQERCLNGQYDEATRCFTAVATLEGEDKGNAREEMKVALTMSEDGLNLTGTLDAQEITFRRMIDSPSFLWGSAEEQHFEETTSLKQIVVTYKKSHKASEELQFAPLDQTLPFTPIVLEGFKSPTGPAQDAGVRAGWYLDIMETFFNDRSEVFEEIVAVDSKCLDSLEEAYRRIHSLYKLLLSSLDKAPLRLVFINAFKVEQLPEAEICSNSGSSLRGELGTLTETGALTGEGFQRSSPVFKAGVRAGWQVDVEQSLLQTQRRLGLVNAGPPEDSLKFLLDMSEERIIRFTNPHESRSEVQVISTESPVNFPGVDSVVVRCQRPDNPAARYLLVICPTGPDHVAPEKEQLQKLAEGWEESCDRLYGLKGEEVSVERDGWDEVRLRALCAHHGWEFSWMTEDDERRRRIAQGGVN